MKKRKMGRSNDQALHRQGHTKGEETFAAMLPLNRDQEHAKQATLRCHVVPMRLANICTCGGCEGW